MQYSSIITLWKSKITRKAIILKAVAKNKHLKVEIVFFIRLFLLNLYVTACLWMEKPHIIAHSNYFVDLKLQYYYYSVKLFIYIYIISRYPI